MDVMESSRRTHRVSSHQLDLLWEFLNSNRDIACAFNRSLQAKDYSKRKWREIADILNAQGDGAYKDWAGWCKYWVDYKAKIKKRVGALRASHMQTGGGRSTVNPLSDQETRFLEILGEDYGQGIPGVRVEPTPEISAPEIATDSPASMSILQNYMTADSQPTDRPSYIASPIIDLPPTVGPPLTPPTIQEPPLTTLTIQEPPLTPPTIREPPTTPRRPTRTPASRSPRHRRRRREPPMSQEAARRALVHTTQMHAEAAVRTADAVERGVEILAEIKNILMRTERRGAFPTTAGQEHCE